MVKSKKLVAISLIPAGIAGFIFAHNYLLRLGDR